LGVNPATLRNWIEAGSSTASLESAAESADVKRLERENTELRRANEILTAWAYVGDRCQAPVSSTR
jgi:transposase